MQDEKKEQILIIDSEFYDEDLAKEIEEALKEYEEDKKNGKIKTFDNVEDLIADLHKMADEQ